MFHPIPSHTAGSSILVGNTANRRNTGWIGTKPDAYYPGMIPVQDVLDRLFDWEAVELPIYVAVPADLDTMTHLDDNGQPVRHVAIPNRKAIAASDTHDVLGVFRDGYQPHQYRQWLLDNVATLLDDNLGIVSAGTAKRRAVAWVEVSVPDSIQTPSGVDFHPTLLAATSFDGSLATTYKNWIRLLVCDNGISPALNQRAHRVKVRHSRHSQLKIADAREALEIVYAAADEFTEAVEQLTNWAITDSEWQQLVETVIPESDSARGRTMAARRRGEIQRLWVHDDRVQPWRGTAFGAVQAFSTWRQHERPTKRGTDRAERAMVEAIDGTVAADDAAILQALAEIRRDRSLVIA